MHTPYHTYPSIPLFYLLPAIRYLNTCHLYSACYLPPVMCCHYLLLTAYAPPTRRSLLLTAWTLYAPCHLPATPFCWPLAAHYLMLTTPGGVSLSPPLNHYTHAPLATHFTASTVKESTLAECCPSSHALQAAYCSLRRTALTVQMDLVDPQVQQHFIAAQVRQDYCAARPRVL